MDGVIPSKEFNEQLKKVVRENLRRDRARQPRQGRWQGGKRGSSSTGTGSTVIGGSCCGTVYASGSVELYGVEWATNYQVDFGGNIGVQTLTHQGNGVWESDDIEVTCEGGTDTYLATMTATGYGPGEVELVVEMVTGGGSGGASACCLSSESGFKWTFKN
jgi:hypothetical protein